MNSTEGQEIDLYICDHLIYDRGESHCSAVYKEQFSINGTGSVECPYGEMNLDHPPNSQCSQKSIPDVLKI